MKNLCAVLAITLLTACAKKEEPPKFVEPKLPKYTLEQWRSDFKSSFEATGTKTDKDGVTEFMACFKKEEKGCPMFSFGKTDGFRSVSHFTPPNTQLKSIADAWSFFRVYVAALECKEPVIIISPTFNSRNGWIFMDKAAIMSDGEVTLEQSFENFKVDRDNEGGRVLEKVTWILSEDQIASLRKTIEAKKIIMRISGSKGYYTVKPENENGFREDASISLFIYDSLMQKMKANGGPECTTN